MAVRRLQVDPVQVTDRLGQSDRSDIVRGSGFEFQRQFGRRSFPYKTPIPVGPYNLCPENA